MSSFGAYIPEGKVGSAKTVYMKKSVCEAKESDSCLFIGRDYRAEYFSKADQMIDDLEKPVYSKNEINNCGEYCQTIYDAGVTCLDPSENPILNLDLEQIYCSRFLRYEKKASGKKVLIIDEAKRASFEASESKRLARKKRKAKGQKARKKCKDALDYIAGGNLDSELTEEQVDAMQAAFSDIFQALQANRPGKALRLIRLVTDPAYEDLKNNIIEILE